MNLNKWQQVCKFVEPLITANVSENVYQKIFEAILEIIFDWDHPHKRSQAPIPNGSAGSSWHADIVLDGDGFGIVIEMKKANIKLGEDEAGQIRTYMRILENEKYRYKYGLIVGNQITVFYDDGDFREVCRFGFNPRGPEGKALFEILDRNVCSEEKLKDYIFADRTPPLEKSGNKKKGDNKTLDEKKPISDGDQPPPPLPGFHFPDLLDVYNDLPGALPTEEKGGDNYEKGIFWRHINIKGWPRKVFYAFVARNEKVEVMFHIEGAGYDNVDRFIREKYEGQHKTLSNPKYEIEYKAAKYGRLVVYVPYRDGYKNMAQCMIDLITLTKDDISKELNGRT
jgi:hypothetical protein